MLPRRTHRTSPDGRFFLPRMPFWMKSLIITLVVASWIPLVLAARARVTKSSKPRIHLIQDMDNQPKYGPQEPSAVFVDGRAMRPVVDGAVARGELNEDDHYYRGYRVLESGTAGEWNVEYYPDFPKGLTVDEAFIRRGQERFNIYCTPCHGYDGSGNGIVNVRALELEEPTWVPPTSLHTDTVRQRPNGHLFNTITHGIRNMAGYGTQVPVRDRWAIVAYVRALQLSQNARPEDVPADVIGTLREGG